MIVFVYVCEQASIASIKCNAVQIKWQINTYLIDWPTEYNLEEHEEPYIMYI